MKNSKRTRITATGTWTVAREQRSVEYAGYVRFGRDLPLPWATICNPATLRRPAQKTLKPAAGDIGTPLDAFAQSRIQDLGKDGA